MATNQTVFWPSLNPVVTEETGTRGGGHMGLDLAAHRGDSVIAPFDGVVIYAGGDGASGYLAGTNIWANGQAKVVRIRRADGLIAHLAHLDTIEVAVGQAVKAGQRVGGAGDTGWSTGVHIHWELRWDESWNGGNWINPRSMNPRIFEGEDDMTPEERKMLTDIHTMLRESTKTGGFFNQIPANVAKAILDAPVKRTGVDKDGKPRTGNATLRGFLASWEHQVGLTRRLVERIVEKVTGR